MSQQNIEEKSARQKAEFIRNIMAVGGIFLISIGLARTVTDSVLLFMGGFALYTALNLR